MGNGPGGLVGIVGVGRMGQAIAKHLMRHGYSVIAQDIDEKAMNAVREAGARTVATPAEVGKQATFVIVAVGYDDEAAAVVGELWVGAAAVYPDDIRLILDRPCPQQGDPVFDARLGPACNHRIQLRAAPDRVAEDLRKTQIIADERSNPEFATGEYDRALTGGVVSRLGAKREGVDLAVTRDLSSSRIERKRLI